MLKYIFLVGAFISWTLFHIFVALKYNTILTIPDSFAYIQMANYFKDGFLEGFWTGWFGFFYSIFLVVGQFFTSDPFLAWKIINIILFNISAIVLVFIGKRYLNFYYNMLLIALFFFSPILLHYNIHILSENIFILLFLLLILFMHRIIENPSFINTLSVWFFLACMYFTRSESFIYLVPIILSFFILAIKKQIDWWKAFASSFIIIISFVLFISPYIYYLHTITGEWGLTNKGSSNIRQAMMRGTETMDDMGFEKAVWELTEDKHHLIAGFAWGLQYNKPTEEYDLKTFLLEDKQKTLYRIWVNQKKLFTQIIPIMISWDIIKIYHNWDYSGFKKFSFLFLIFTPLVLFLFWLYHFIKNKNNLLFIFVFPLFIFAALFFTLFFVLERYFIIFLPFFLLIISYGIQELLVSLEKIQTWKFILIGGIIAISYYIGVFYYINSLDDNSYKVKKIAWEWIKENIENIKTWNETLKIMERFPITTYYAWVNERWLTPYVENVDYLLEYAKYNKIDILVVDSLDFRKYRKQINILLSDKFRYNGLKMIQKFEENGEKVMLYQFNF